MTDRRQTLHLGAATLCGVAGFMIFQFLGNATHGYIATNSLFYWWGFQWVNPESETEHAWLILALSIFLFVRNLQRDATGQGSETGKATAALVGGLLLHVVGYVAQQPRISILALLLYIWGILATAGGRRWGSASAFPLAFMVFAIPVNSLDTVGFWLRMWVVEAGSRLAHLFGIAVLRNGTQLTAPNGSYQYDVVAACSGTRSLMALSALSLFIGYMWFRPAWLRGAFLLLSLPLVYLGNVLRISSIILAAAWGGQVWGDRVHDLMGYGIFVVVLGGVMAAAEAMARSRPDWTTAEASSMPRSSNPARWEPTSGGVAAIVAVVAIASAGYLAHRSSHPLRERSGVKLEEDGKNPIELPAFLGTDWMGTRIEPTPVELSILPPDTGYSRKLYVSREGANQQVLLSIVLSGRDRSSIHRPELCLVGQGWTIEGSSHHSFGYPGRPDANFDATILRVRYVLNGSRGQESVPELVAYWYVGADRVVSTQMDRMFVDGWNRMVHGRSDRWAYVLLKTGAADGDDEALRRIQSVLNSALPEFQPAMGVRSEGLVGK